MTDTTTTHTDKTQPSNSLRTFVAFGPDFGARVHHIEVPEWLKPDDQREFIAELCATSSGVEVLLEAKDAVDAARHILEELGAA